VSTTLAISSPHSGSARISLFNATGTLIYSFSTAITEGTNAVRLPLPAQLPTGVYIVRTTTGSESSISRLIVE
ncbi:MAG TPA: T9SS type A sorting domain-containing protein, partial [Puia sp.]|nr:T9SS type A sorting domain-containing protein [Puia sp.]